MLYDAHNDSVFRGRITLGCKAATKAPDFGPRMNANNWVRSSFSMDYAGEADDSADKPKQGKASKMARRNNNNLVSYIMAYKCRELPIVWSG